MRELVIDPSRLRDSGWDSFRPELFLNEPGRQTRDVGDFFVKLLEDFSKGKRVLEVCSGGGKLLIQLARAGFEMVGIDLNLRMIEICRRAVNEEPPEIRNRIRLVHEDMCTFELSEEFDFIILEDDAFVYPLTQEDQISCLRAINRHLKRDGHLILCCTTPQKELKSEGAPGYDPIRQIKTMQNEWTAFDDGGNPRIVKEGFERRRLVYPNELELLLKIAGLEPVERWGDYHRSPFTNPAEQEYCYLIRKT
jgi:SAM-dependent methyltransferase